MPFFFLTFEKKIEVTVEAGSLEALKKAADEQDQYELDHDWGCDGWVATIYEVSGRMAKDIKKADCGLINEEILCWEDYQKQKEKVK
jgi:hypothetical protein